MMQREQYVATGSLNGAVDTHSFFCLLVGTHNMEGKLSLFDSYALVVLGRSIRGYGYSTHWLSLEGQFVVMVTSSQSRMN